MNDILLHTLYIKINISRGRKTHGRQKKRMPIFFSLQFEKTHVLFNEYKSRLTFVYLKMGLFWSDKSVHSIETELNLFQEVYIVAHFLKHIKEFSNTIWKQNQQLLGVWKTYNFNDSKPPEWTWSEIPVIRRCSFGKWDCSVYLHTKTQTTITTEKRLHCINRVKSFSMKLTLTVFNFHFVHLL